MIELANLTVLNGSFRLEDAAMSVSHGSYAVLMGKSGSGKTTLLEAVCGLKTVESGTIHIDGADVTHLRPAARGIGFVPQDGALFSAMSVRQHLGFPLRIRRIRPDEINRRVDELAGRLLLHDLLDRRPDELSGGERQRVALGRAISFRPQVLCLDEPLSSLDDDTRRDMIALLKDLHRAFEITVLHVTHNRSEAEQMADQTFQLVGGKVSVERSPEEPK